jgi:hypothetical protein
MIDGSSAALGLKEVKMRNMVCVTVRRRCDVGALLFLLLAQAGILAGTLCAGNVAEKPAAAAEEHLLALQLDGSYDPERGFLEATARLTFAGPADERRLWLADGMQLSSVRVADEPSSVFPMKGGVLAELPARE